jgi:hypothetical protein
MDLLGVAGEQVPESTQPSTILPIKNNFMSDPTAPKPSSPQNHPSNPPLDAPHQKNRGSELPDLFGPDEIPTDSQVDWFSHIDKSNKNPNKIVLTDEPGAPIQEFNFNSATKNCGRQSFGFGTPETGKADSTLYSQMSPTDLNKAILQERLRNFDQQELIAKDENSDEDENNTFVG